MVIQCSVIGRFAHYAPSVWLYAANMALLAAIGLRLVALTPELEDDEHALDRKVSLVFLVGTSVLCFGISLIDPAKALWIYLLNLAAPQTARWIGGARRGRRG
jgi:hypothetical protein